MVAWLVLRWVHLVGIALFAGCGVAATVLNRRALAADGGGAGLVAAQRQVGRVADIGSGLAFASGIGLVFASGLASGFGTAGWLHVMIACGIAASAANGIAGARLRRLDASPPADASSLRDA